MVHVHYPIENQNGGGAIINRVSPPVCDDSEDGYFDVSGAFIPNDLMRRAGKPSPGIDKIKSFG